MAEQQRWDIPGGWRQLGPHTATREGDHYWSGQWCDVTLGFGTAAVRTADCVIRRYNLEAPPDEAGTGAEDHLRE